ncbi:hypothetical protein GJ496_008062 [Pomphorhynchus laevis]|nr:hypothetical protein GJ496_008062 [Pomphorhynchus laevis]
MSDNIEKLYSLMHFARNAADDICRRIIKLCTLRKEFICQNYLLSIGYLLSVLATIDELKNIKSSVKNDFSAYRRALKFTGDCSNVSNSVDESQRLSIFLATPNIIRNMITERLLKESQGYEEVFSDIINIGLDYYHKRYYITSRRKFDLIRMVGFCISVLDIDNRLVKLDAKKKISLDSVDKMFQDVPCIPLCQDTQTNPYLSFVNMKKSDSSNIYKWQGHLIRRKPVIETVYLKNEYVRLMLQLSKWNTTLVETSSSMDCSMVIECLICLAKWQSSIIEMHSWNLANPVSDDDSTSQYSVYDRAVKLNMSDDENESVVNLIWMIKSLQSALQDRSVVIEEAIERFIAHKLKLFLDRDVNKMLTKLSKKRKEFTHSVLTVVQDILMDSQKSSESYVCLAQIDLLQMIVQSVLSDKPINGRKTLKKDLDILAIDKLYTFYRDSIMWSYLLNFKGTYHFSFLKFIC